MRNHLFRVMQTISIFFAFGEPYFGYFLVKLMGSKIAEVVDSFAIRYKVYFYGFNGVSTCKVDISSGLGYLKLLKIGRMS